MDCRQMIDKAELQINDLINSTLDIVTINRPDDIDIVLDLVKITSKLSPIYANSIEHQIVRRLNESDWDVEGTWERQDPGFPDVVFNTDKLPHWPGIEIKAWYPFATEITARFRESQNLLKNQNTDVAMIVWIPEHIVWGKAKIIDIRYFTADSIAKARDNHYHNPPDYLVIEPQDTSDRTDNLKQRNVEGYKIQDKKLPPAAVQEVKSWGPNGSIYSPSPEYQAKLQQLKNKFTYRLDTNFAKVDRIEHTQIEKFKTDIMNCSVGGRTIKQWGKILSELEEGKHKDVLKELIQG